MNLLGKLMDCQRKELVSTNRLDYNDLKRLTKYVNDKFFTDECCIWAGSTSSKKVSSRYITFYFKKKKVSLYRILYYNFEGDISDDEYIRSMCPNKGICCNVKHLQKFKYKI